MSEVQGKETGKGGDWSKGKSALPRCWNYTFFHNTEHEYARPCSSKPGFKNHSRQLFVSKTILEALVVRMRQLHDPQTPIRNETRYASLEARFLYLSQYPRLELAKCCQSKHQSETDLEGGIVIDGTPHVDAREISL